MTDLISREGVNLTQIGEWQENHMDRLCREYVQLLQSDAAPSERFWALEERIKEDKTRPGVRIELRKGDMMFDLVRLICEEVITIDDLSDCYHTTTFCAEMGMVVNTIKEVGIARIVGCNTEKTTHKILIYYKLVIICSWHFTCCKNSFFCFFT